MDRFCKAAADGHLDLLRHTTRRDCNLQDEDGFSPTLWASYSGRLDALRLLVGRGGDPDKPDLLGNSSLHWSASNGHFDCVSFLVNFGANIWALNNDFQTAKDSAALRNHKVILDFLDQTMAKQSALNPKLVQKSKEKAIQDAEKNIKQFEKIQRKASKKAEKEEKKNELNRRKLLEPIQLTNNSNRLQPVEYSTLTTTGTLRWTASNKTKNKNKDLPLKFSDLVNNNANTIQRTNQFNSLLLNVKGTLTTGTSSRLARSLGSLGAVSRKVQLKKQLNNSDEQTAGQKSDEQPDSLPQRKQTAVQGANNDQTDSKNIQQNTTIKNSLANNNPTVRSLTGLCRDTDVLYVRKETDYGLINYNNKMKTPLMTTNRMNNLNNLAKKDDAKELNRQTTANEVGSRGKNGEEERTSLANSSVKSLDNNNNKRNLDQKSDHLKSEEERTKFRLKELFANKSDNENNSLYCRNNRTIRQNSININKISTLFKRGLTRATSESDIIHELRKGESNCLKNSSSLLNKVENRSQMIQSTTKLNSLNNSPTSSLNSNSTASNCTSSMNKSIFERRGFGSIVFRQNLFAQVLQLSKQLNDDNYEEERLDNVETFKTTQNRIKPVSIGKNRLLLSVHKPDKPTTTALNKNSNQQTHLTNQLQLIQKMNKQLRKNNEENDSIGNSVESSLSSRSTNSSTNSTISSNRIETELELTDDLNMKLSSKTMFKTRKSLKLIEQQSAMIGTNHHEIDEQNVLNSSLNRELSQQIRNDEKLDNQVTEQTNDKTNEEKQSNNEERNKETEKQSDKEMTEETELLKKDNQLKQNDEICLKNLNKNLDNLDDEIDKKIDDKIDNRVDKKIDHNDKLNGIEEMNKRTDQNVDQRKQAIKETSATTTTTKKYCETYEKLNRQTLNSRIETSGKMNKLNDKLYEKKNDKLLKMKDKFLNRMNARQDERARLNDVTHDKQIKKIDTINNLLNESSDDSSDNNSLNKQYGIKQLDRYDHSDEQESWNQDAGTEIAIEKISTTVFCKANEAATTTACTRVPIENKIKKFENLNCSRNEVSDSHVYKLVVKNRELNTQKENDRNSLSTSNVSSNVKSNLNSNASSNASSNAGSNCSNGFSLNSTTNFNFNLPTQAKLRTEITSPSSNLQSSSTTINSTTNSNLTLNTVKETVRDTVRQAVKSEITKANLPVEQFTKSTFKNTILNTSSSESKLPITNATTLNNKVRTGNQVNLNSFNSDHKNGFRTYENEENKDKTVSSGIDSRMNIELFLANQTTNNLLEDTCL